MWDGAKHDADLAAAQFMMGKWNNRDDGQNG